MITDYRLEVLIRCNLEYSHTVGTDTGYGLTELWVRGERSQACGSVLQEAKTVIQGRGTEVKPIRVVGCGEGRQQGLHGNPISWHTRCVKDTVEVNNCSRFLFSQPMKHHLLYFPLRV